MMTCSIAGCLFSVKYGIEKRIVHLHHQEKAASALAELSKLCTAVGNRCYGGLYKHHEVEKKVSIGGNNPHGTGKGRQLTPFSCHETSATKPFRLFCHPSLHVDEGILLPPAGSAAAHGADFL
jgi:hypothetical protein